MAEAATTPDRSPSRQATMITAAQKQALIDNMQLEITERARKLRAQYALHAQGLRSRLEMRVNRIPQSLRSTNIVELIDKYAQQTSAPTTQSITAPVVPKVAITKHASPVRPVASPAKPRGVKRSSNEISIHSDKENVEVHDDLSLPKKRTKTAAAGEAASGATRAGRGVSRKVDPSKVLSPKSHNSRTLPRSPIKGQSSSSGLSSPQKSYLARPISPLKPGTSVSAATAALASMVGDAKSTRAANSRPGTAASNASTASTGSLRGKRAGATTRADMPPPPVPAKATRGRTASASSNVSNTSSGTTVITKKPAARAAAAGTTAKKGLVSKMAGMAQAATGGRKATGTTAKKAAAAPSVAAAAAAGGRTLRSRK